MTRRTKYEIVIAVSLIAVILVVAMFTTKETVYVEENGQKVPSLSTEDLQKPGTKVSVLAASELCDAANDCFPEAEALQYDNFTDVFNAVSAGKADAALAYTSFLTIVPESQPELTNIPENIEEYEYGFALPKNDAGDKLLKEMNAYLGEMIDSGEFDALQKKWAECDGKDVMGDIVVRLPDRLDSVNITVPVFRDQVYVFVPAKTQTVRASGPAAFWRTQA